VIRVVIADDQDLVRSGLQLVLETRGCEVVGLAGDGREAIDVVGRTKPDVVLMDIRMPVMDGIAATRELSAAGLPSKVLILTTYDLDRYVYDALAAGAAGFLLKATPPTAWSTASAPSVPESRCSHRASPDDSSRSTFGTRRSGRTRRGGWAN
jgi:DNA-binding NarL/FixJ family response regulator